MSTPDEPVAHRDNPYFGLAYYDEQFGAKMSRAKWRAFVLRTPGLEEFRSVMFQRLVPNLREIGLMSPRILPHYEKVGLMKYFGGSAADKLTGEQMLEELEAAA